MAGIVAPAAHRVPERVVVIVSGGAALGAWIPRDMIPRLAKG